MKILNRIFENVITKIDKISKPQKDFLLELFKVVLSLYGRGNFLNFARYSKYNECTFRRNFSKYFDWVKFNFLIICLYNSPTAFLIGAIDCSYIAKSGKKTFGLDKFWSGVASKALKGLEISVLSLINVHTGTAWALDVCQTPANLKSKEGTINDYTRINFYIEQLLDCLSTLKNVLYFTADGFYAKKKFFDAVTQEGKHLITKLRSDANLRFLFTGEHKKGKKGAKKKYDGKVKFNDLNKWFFEGIDYKYNHLQIYYQILNSPQFGRNLKVILLLNTRTNKYVLLASTDISQQARQIVEYYQLRFQIEFLFRDAKQFACLNHCQARCQHKLDFHFNMSLSTINLSKAIMAEKKTKSLNNLVRQSYNENFMNFIFSKLSLKAELQENKLSIKQIIEFGSMRV